MLTAHDYEVDHDLHGVRWAGEELARHQEQVEAAAATRMSGVS